MDTALKNIEHSLKDLCLEMIPLLDELKSTGLLDEEEYKKQMYQKIEFLKNIKRLM